MHLFEGKDGLLRLRSPSDRVIEPSRLFAESFEGGRYILYEGGEVLEPDNLPRGRYFYHWTEGKNLDAITRRGLSSSMEEAWRMEQYREIVKQREPRLYLVALEYDCLSHIRFNQEGLAALRFKRLLVKEKEKTFDGRYGGHIFSFFIRDALITSSDLEVCLDQEWVGGRKRIEGEWLPLDPGKN